jgi:hypothetical protein
MFGAETNGAGIGWIDFDGNGLPDLYVPNGCRLPYDSADLTHVDALFLNRGHGRFVDVAEGAGIRDNQFGQGVAVADYDNDGWDDVYVCNFGSNLLYQNCADGTFRPIEAGSTAAAWHGGAAFGDLDHDGDLDLYVTIYAEADLTRVPVCYDSATGTRRVYCGPDRYTSTRHRLLLNQGDGSFRDAASDAGCDQTNGKGMGVVLVDLDHDTWPEIFVANDMTPSFLYRNLHRSLGQSPRFEEIAVASGVAFDGHGRLAAGMGVACGDADGDGRLDLYVSHYHRQGNSFYRNLGQLSFRDDAAGMNLLIPSLPYLGFGCEFLDYDNDGWLDLYVVNGHVLGPNYPDWKMRPQLYHSQHGGRFEEVSDRAGPYFRGAYLGRGSATCDFDNDGAVDVAALQLDTPIALWRNVHIPRGHAIALRCIGRQANRNGVNAELTIGVGGRRQVRQVLAGGSYQSSPDMRVLIGTGDLASVQRIELRWPSGRLDVAEELPARGLYVWHEGSPPRLVSHWNRLEDAAQRNIAE